ncbi:helix-turn-helix transcriptional regulator [Rhizobium sp. AN63]|uniref:response regulator transcription factor n=1 Tax=Rhizobium sp. AN63 TaxID=3035210 RepID=UPI0027D3C0D8|nr:helix-turn-helix transcriptional regulator [Rhizobium sp. AN63]MDQ4408651.1 helix-turn-helix transcriptional regulator [Rhizobium sp. AN63]
MSGAGLSRYIATSGSSLAFLIHRKAVFELHGEHDPIPQHDPREKECLHWSALGKTNDEIAEIPGLSIHTTQRYLMSARHKLGAASTTSATALAIQLHLIILYGNTQDCNIASSRAG